jgi:putative ABC transport system substrate-binding protein
VDVSNPANVIAWEAFQSVAEPVGVQAERVDLRLADELEAAFATPAVQRAELLFNAATPLLGSVRTRLAELALQRRLPGFSVVRDFADAGLLMSYGPSYVAIYRRAATVVDRILRGAAPADIPVEQPSAFELVVNRTTAQALGLRIPPDVAAQVTEWVQ